MRSCEFGRNASKASQAIECRFDELVRRRSHKSAESEALATKVIGHDTAYGAADLRRAELKQKASNRCPLTAICTEEADGSPLALGAIQRA